MAAKQVTCYIAVCDDCGEEYDNEDGYTPHWPSTIEAIDDAVDSADWWNGGTELLCRDCKEKPHVLVHGLFEDDCDRCPHPAEEHVPATA